MEPIKSFLGFSHTPGNRAILNGRSMNAAGSMKEFGFFEQLLLLAYLDRLLALTPSSGSSTSSYLDSLS